MESSRLENSSLFTFGIARKGWRAAAYLRWGAKPVSINHRLWTADRG